MTEPRQQAMKITMRSLRLTSDQSQRLLEIHRSKAVECYEFWDWKLRDLGLVAIGPIPNTLKAAKERWLYSAWEKVQHMAASGDTPGLSKIKEMDGLLNQMNHVAYRINKQYSTLTNAGAELAVHGRAVILPRDTRREVT